MKYMADINWKNFLASAFWIFALYGCGKFSKGESEDLAPFAKQTVSMIGSLEYGLNESDIIYLRNIHNYFENEDAYQRYYALENQVGNMLTALIVYSMQIVTISELNTTENIKANKLADVVLELSSLVNKDQVIQNENRDAEKTEEILISVRKTEDYLLALRLLLPLINEFSAHAGRVLDELRMEKRKVATIIDTAIDNKYKSAVRFHRELRLVKDDMYDTLYNLSQYGITGDVKYLEKMKSYGMYPVRVALKNKKSLSAKEQEKLHREITERLRTVNENYQQLAPDVREYNESVRELNRALEIKDDAIREAHLTFVVWTRAYQKMASGKADPAEWFDISDTGALLFGTAKRAAGI